MMHLPVVTIVTPTYNQASLLPRTIESVLIQDYENIEYIVIDDGSTDETAEVLAACPERVQRVHQANRGQAAALNRGWQMARGEILSYLSSDDLLRSDAVRRVVEAFTRHLDVAVIYCDFDLIDVDGARIRSVKTGEFDRRELTEDLVCHPGPGAFFRRAVFEVTGGWDEAIRQVPDFDFWLKASRYGPFLRLPIELASYRIHDASASFRVVGADRSEEIVGVVERFWSQAKQELRGEDLRRRYAVSSARLLAARSHFVSGRYGIGCLNALRAWRMSPHHLIRPTAWRILVGGLVRRSLYLARQALRRAMR